MCATRSSGGNDLAEEVRASALNSVPMEPERAIAASAVADAAGLRYVAATALGLRRLGSPGRFRYVDADGRVVRDAATLDRIRALAIPPAYEEVWICTSPRGHLQATGRDARGRKQYRYHARWQRARDGIKFDRIVAFGDALPRLRRRLARDLPSPGLPRDKVIALIVALLDATRVRIGNSAYARDNQSYGLTTLRSRHARFMGGRLRLRFRGKGGAEHDLVIDDRRLARIARRCHELPGQNLFQYLDDGGARRGIDSDMVNAYLQAAMGDSFTAKDFRTWGATLHAILRLAETPLPEPCSARALTACITRTIREVAAELRNTPTICRKSYINPVVFEAWREGRLHRFFADAAGRRGRRGSEALALAFLRAQAPTEKRSPPLAASPGAAGTGDAKSTTHSTYRRSRGVHAGESPTRRRKRMPRGDKSSYTAAQKRKAAHIEESYRDQGVEGEEAAARAWATVNKQSGGGERSGSGRNTPEATKKAARKSSARRAAQTRARRPAERKKPAAKAAAAKGVSGKRGKR